MAGAGRRVGTWIMAQSNDRSLLEFLGVDYTRMFARRGTIDTVALHSRWDRRITLLQNGKKTPIRHPGGQPVVDNTQSLYLIYGIGSCRFGCCNFVYIAKTNSHGPCDRSLPGSGLIPQVSLSRASTTYPMIVVNCKRNAAFLTRHG